MKTKLSLITLFACAVAGTTLLADGEVYDGQTIESGRFWDSELANSSWVKSVIGSVSSDVSFCGANLSGANFSESNIVNAYFSSTDSSRITNLTDAIFIGATIGTSETDVSFGGANLSGANFSESNIVNAYFSSTDSSRITNLTDAIFIGATIGTSETSVSFYGANLSGANFSDSNIIDADFESRSSSGVTNLMGAVFKRATIGTADTAPSFSGANLAGADFSDSKIIKASFDDLYGITNLTAAVFKRATIGTADTKPSFSGANLAGADFSDSKIIYASFYSSNSSPVVNLKNANFSWATIGSVNSHVVFCGANLSGANFSNSNIVGADFYASSSTGATDLTNSDFSGATIGNVNRWIFVSFSGARLIGADFSESDIVYAEFDSSYGVTDLTNSNFSGSTIAVADKSVSFQGACLTEACFVNTTIGELADFRESDLTRVDFRGATGVIDISFAGTIKNTLLSDGKIEGFSMTSSEDSFTIKKHIPKEGAESVSAKVYTDASISGGATLTMAENSVLEVIGGKTLTIGDSGSLVLGEKADLHFAVADSSVSSVSVADNGNITLSETAKLIIDYAGSFDGVTSFSVITWTDAASVSGLDSLIKGSNIWLLVDGVACDSELWNFSTENNALTIFGVDNKTIIIKELEQIVTLKTEEYVGIFDASLMDYRGSISGSGNVYSEYTVNFGADASAHTGTTYIDGGKFTIVDTATLGSGKFAVAEAATFAISGTRTFENTLSGAGTFETTGTVTLNGDLSTHTGTTNVASGTLTVSESALLGTGAFDVAGTLALNGNRTFANATSGAGTLDVASGNLTFTKNVGTATLDISSGASATFTGASDGFAGALTGAGALTTTQDFTLSGDASGFNGKTSVTAGTFTVSESATLGTGTFDVAGTLALNGDRTFANATSGDGKIEVSSSSTTFTNDIGTKTLSIAQSASAALNDSVDLTHANAEAEIAGTLNLNGDRDFSATLSGAGTLATNGNVNFTSDASAFAGTTEISSETFTVSESALLGTGAFDVAGTLALNGNRTFANTTSGTGTLDIASGNLTFTKNVGTATLDISSDASATFAETSTGFSGALTGAGTLTTTQDFALGGNASGFSGKTSVTSGTFTVSENATLGTGAFDIAGTLALNGDRTFANATSGDGKIEVSSGSTTFANDIGTKTLAIAQDASAALNDGVDLTSANAEAEIAGTLNLNGDRDFSATLSGAGTLATNGNVNFSSDASAFAGTTEISSGTFAVSESATLGTGEFDIAGTLAVNGDRTFANATGGDGKIEVSSGTTTFATDIGTKTLSIAQGASAALNDGVDLTHANAEAEIAGTLNLNGNRDFSATLSGAGKLATNGTINFGSDTNAFSGEISVESGTFVVSQGTTLNISGSLSVSDGATLKLFGGDAASVSVSAGNDASIVFADGANLIVDVTTQDRVGFITTVMGWTAGTSVYGLDGGAQNSNISLVLNGSVLGSDEWSYRLSETGLTVYTLGGTVIISETYQVEVLDRGINAMFDPNLAEYRGKISANGEVHSTGTLVFAADSREHTGTTFVDSGTFTIVDAAQLGSGDYVVAGAGTLRIEGTRDFDKTISGAGIFATSGTITFSGDANAHTGTTKVEDGSLTIAQSAKLGTGAFDVAGTLVLLGDRVFENATLGTGTVDVASGNLTFTKNVGTATLDISSGASATFAGTSTGFAGALTGAGALTTTQDFTLSGDASGFSGKTSVTAGTFTVAESATLGTGEFDITGTLALNGDRSLENTFIGSGTIVTSGTISLGGDLSAHTGTTNVKGGTLTLGDSVMLGSGNFSVGGTLVVSANTALGNGNFDVAGTLALNGDRTFANATSGDGEIEVSSGSTTFANDIGTKTLSVAQGASAALNDGVDLTNANAEAEIAGTLNLNGNRDFSATLSGAGKLATSGNVNFTSDASGFSGKTSVTSGTFTVSENATLGTGAFDVAGTLALNGDRTFVNTTSGDGKIEISSGSTTFTNDIGTKTLSIAQSASAALNDSVDLTHANAEAEIAGTLNLNGDRDFSATLSGAGTLATNGNVNFSSDASAFAGTTEISSGTFTVSESATLGTGAFDVAGTLALNGDRTFANATSGNGKIEVSSGSTTFTNDIGTKTLSVAQGASAALNDGVDLTHANAEAQIAGALNLNGDRDFSATLSGAGKLATRGTVNFSSDTNAFSGEISVESETFVVAQGTTLDISGALSVSDGATMKLFGGDGIAADVVAASGASIEFADGAKLLVDVTTQNQVGFITTVMGWTSETSVSGLDLLEKNVDISFVVNGTALASDAWNYTLSDHGLTIYTLGGTIIITEREQIVVLDRGINAMFDPNLGEYFGKISGNGELHSTGIIDFGANASAHTGTTFVDSGTFTIVDATQLGSGDYVVAGAGTLRIEGTRDFDKTISGAGIFATSGTITFSGDANAHTGTTKVEDGSLTIAQSAKLGTGAFDVAGTLVLVGDRVFENATLGTGTVDVASGNLTFTKNVGTATLDISSGASATFTGASDGFAGALTGAGALTTTQDFTLSGDASGFSGKTSVTAGTFTVAESATLGTGTFDVAGTLALNGDRTFANTTSGDGKIEISSGSTTFATDIGTKTLSVAQGASATLNDGVNLAHANAETQVAGTLTLNSDRDFSATLSGAGTLASNGNVNFTSDASGFSGKTSVTSGTFTVSENATLGTGAFDVAGTLALNGDRTFANATSGDGKIEVSSGSTTFANDIGTKTLAIAQGASAALNDGVDLTNANAEAEIAGTLTLNSDRDFSATLSGAGKLATNGNVNFSSDASGFSGKTSVTSGTFTVSESALLGTGAFDVAGTLALNGDRTFANTTSGDGKIEVSSGTTTFATDIGTKTLSIAQRAAATLNGGVDLTHANAEAQIAGTLNLLGVRTVSTKTNGNGVISLAPGSDVSFAKAVGVKQLAVKNGATLRGNVSMTYGASAELSLAGALVLNADKSEKVALDGGTVALANSATLELEGNGVMTRASAAEIQRLEKGEEVTIFENGTVSGDVVSFLKTDDDLSAYATDYAVVYDVENGLSVQIVKSTQLDTDVVDMPDGWQSAFDALTEDFSTSYDAGFYSKAELENAGFAISDPLVHAILTDPDAARIMAMNILPGHYAAVVAMKTEAFYSDVRSISSRLEQRRYDRYARTGKTEFFVQMQGNHTENGDGNDSPTFDVNTIGFLAGVDCKLDSETTLGVTLGSDFGVAKIHNNGGKLEMSDWRLTGFIGETIADQVFFNAGAQFGASDIDIKRKSVWGDPKGETAAWNAAAFVESGILLPLSETVAAMPYVGLAYSHTWVEHFREEGAGALWDVDTITADSLRGRVGCEFSWSFEAAEMTWRIGLDMAYSHDFLGEESDVDAHYLGGEKFPTITAKTLPEDMFSAGPTIDIDVSEIASIYGGYTFSAGTDSSVNHSANLGFRIRF